MAESRRKADSRKSKPVVADAETDDAKTSRLDRLALLLYLEGGAAIIAGMVVLSQFLSQGKPDQTVLIVAGALAAVLAVGITFTVLARRRVQKS